MITIVKRGAPTINTIGSIGQHYVDLDGGIEYECVDIIAKQGDMKHTVETDKFVSKTVFGDVISEYIWETIGENTSGGKVFVIKYINNEYDPESVRSAFTGIKEAVQSEDFSFRVVFVNFETNYIMEYTSFEIYEEDVLLDSSLHLHPDGTVYDD